MLKNLCPKGTYCHRLENFAHPDTGIIGNYPVGLDVYPNNDDHQCPKFKYCPKGTGKTGKAWDKPRDIARGTMQEVLARGDLSDAVQVPAGWYTVALPTDGSDPRYPDTQLYDVEPCPAGYYCPSGSYEKIACPAGTWRNDLYGKDVKDCGPCPAGTFCPNTATTTADIQTCGAGRFCPEGSLVE